PSGGLFGGGDDDVELPFGQANAWRLNLQVSQPLFTGGRLTAQRDQAQVLRESAELGLSTAQAQAMLDVGQAFLDAALSDRLLAIAQASYEQADRAYRQTLAQREVGRQSEFDLLRAQVDRDTLQPEIVARQAARRVAYLRLKQLLEIPLDTEVQAVVDLVEGELAPPAMLARAIADAEAGNLAGPRTALSQAQNEVRVRDAAVTIVRSQRLPTVSVQSAYGLVNYSGAPAFDDYRDNWSVGATMAVPIFTGGRLRAEEQMARAEAEQARQQLRLANEVADLDRESAREQLMSARAAWDATAGTVRQAQRAYEIAELRYKEGLSTQLELSDARLLLEQAQLNRATAGRALQLARLRAALLPDLPLGTASSAQVGTSGSAQPVAARTSGAMLGGSASAGATR
ncbi:MAG: TolC family protein, partial [Vicinamibacterales bacterium]|nr:TolC family protein [Vicinamibacterales bacterium]